MKLYSVTFNGLFTSMRQSRSHYSVEHSHRYRHERQARLLVTWLKKQCNLFSICANRHFAATCFTNAYANQTPRSNGQDVGLSEVLPKEGGALEVRRRAQCPCFGFELAFRFVHFYKALRASQWNQTRSARAAVCSVLSDRAVHFRVFPVSAVSTDLLCALLWNRPITDHSHLQLPVAKLLTHLI